MPLQIISMTHFACAPLCMTLVLLSLLGSSKLELVSNVLDFLSTFLRCLLACQEWYDYKLAWIPREYGGVDRLYVPARDIWLPDIVLYNK